MKKKETIKKLFRYLVSGYFWNRRNANKCMDKVSSLKLEVDGEYYDKPIAVYTAVYGNYDKIKEPLYKSANIHYYVLTDQAISDKSVWKKIEYKSEKIDELSGKDKSRYFKMCPDILFPEYEYSLYLDGNVQIKEDIFDIITYMKENHYFLAMNEHSIRDCIYDEGNAVIAFGLGRIRDVKSILHRYRKEGFPPKFGLFDNCIIFREHNNPQCKAIMKSWWDEYEKNSCKRDQLSFCYCLWKNGFNKQDVLTIGSNAYKNPKFIIKEHSCKVKDV